MQLYTPTSYLNASEAVRQAVVNGCGTGGWKACLIPDTLWGMSISEACNIHDWMYYAGSSIKDKEEADRVFLNNMLRLIDDSCWVMKRLRRNRAYAYYLAVKMFGGPAFWEGKNSEDNLVEVI